MFSPYVRRLRLADALRTMREDRNLTASETAKIVYQSRGKLSKLETAQTRPDAFEIMDMLERLNVKGDEYDTIVRLARDAAKKGWWDRYANVMGPRQRIYADLESGAASIRVYSQTGPSGPLQTPEFTKALIDLDSDRGPLQYLPKRAIEARMQRQRHILGPDGPRFEEILDECLFHRHAAPTEIMAGQARHLAEVCRANERITCEVLPCHARFSGGLLPRGPFVIYTFSDPADPQIVALDTYHTDIILTKQAEVEPYIARYNRIRDAALSAEDSIKFLDTLADQLTK